MTITTMNGKLFDVDTGDELPYSYNQAEHEHCPGSKESIQMEETLGPSICGAQLCGCGTIILEENE